MATGAGRPTKFCGARCSNRFRDRIKRAESAGAEIVDTPGLAEVTRRWGWACGICGWPVSLQEEWPSLRALVIDHRVPLSAGGQHSLTNLQPAHRECNLAKGERRDPDFWALRPLIGMAA